MIINKCLTCFDGPGCTAVHTLHVGVETKGQDGMYLCYELTGDIAQIRIPAPQTPAAVEGLWKNTCFELFIAVEGDSGYHEFNFSPSGQWAIYAFSGYRLRSFWKTNQAPDISVHQTMGSLRLEALINSADLPANNAAKMLQLGLSAVIEANNGKRSYWALSHPSLQPDFHHRAGFIGILEPWEAV